MFNSKRGMKISQKLCVTFLNFKVVFVTTPFFCNILNMTVCPKNQVTQIDKDIRHEY